MKKIEDFKDEELCEYCHVEPGDMYPKQYSSGCDGMFCEDAYNNYVDCYLDENPEPAKFKYILKVL